MLFKSLHFKLVLVFILFIICVMCVIGAIMLVGVFNFFTGDFKRQLDAVIDDEFIKNLSVDSGGADYYLTQRDRLRAYSGPLGIDIYRNYYVLDEAGNFLAGSSEELGKALEKTPNMLAAMNGRRGSEQIFGSDYMDYALPVSVTLADGSVRTSIVYIKDSQERMRSQSWMIFSIIVQTLLISLIIAVVLSFFLAKAITSPIQNVTARALEISQGDFGKRIEISSDDEIGALSSTFNDMARALKNNLDSVSGEREKLHTIFLYLKDGVLAFSPDGALLHINPQGEKILGVEFGYENTLADFEACLNLKIDKERLAANMGTGIIYRNVSCRSLIIDVYADIFKYTEDGREADGVIIVLNDITQPYILEKSRREFIANVSHELRTPLTSIKGAAETILNNPEGLPPETRVRFMEIINNESDRMTRIVRDLLLINRIDDNRVMWEFSDISASQLTRGVYAAMEIEAKNRGHSFELKISAASDVIRADKERLEQVLINVISNAFKYTPNGGHIEFILTDHFSSGLSGVKFTVRDDGVGIPEEDLPYIFERFYRVDKARAAETGGTGLGLAIAREIVLAHNGKISIGGNPSGRGTAVAIIIPAAAGEEPPESAD